jgi:hypothetical protein
MMWRIFHVVKTCQSPLRSLIGQRSSSSPFVRNSAEPDARPQVGNADLQALGWR